MKKRKKQSIYSTQAGIVFDSLWYLHFLGLCLCHIVGLKNLSGFVTDTTLKLNQTTCCWNTPIKTELQGLEVLQQQRC